MNQKVSHYRKIYVVNNPELIADEKMDGLLMCGSKNWEYYFTYLDAKIRNILDFEEIRNVELVEFDSEKGLFSFMENIDKHLLLNFSLEHERPCILKLV